MASGKQLFSVNIRLMKITRGWQIALTFSLAATLILVTWLRIKDTGRGIKEIKTGFEEIKSSPEAVEITDANKIITDLVKELRGAPEQPDSLDKSSNQKISFDPSSSTHIIGGKPVKLESGAGLADDKRVSLENMTLIGDWNGDEEADFAGILSLTTPENTSWYLSVILSGENPVPLPAVLLSEGYPIITGIAEAKDNSISVIETEWKEQRNFVRIFNVGKSGVEEEK